ncbi:ArsR/SmtB family transcription factor [Sedimentitalea sp. HM32M-2]|uniref:ArsR/SmtB family transcription factor n=1 Tax=Sedimentitalea sp. HM32M-2 TaxID=3351566 RepID=UPI00363B761E
MNALCSTFSALSDATRLAIVEQLMDQGECSAGDLVARAAMTGPAVSRHLKVLRQAGLVTQRARGTQRLYSVRPEGLRAIADWTLSRRTFWETSLDRLDAAIRREKEECNG